MPKLMMVCLAVTIPLAFAQSLEKRITPVEASQAAQFNRAGTVGVAVLVGVGKYPRYSGLSELHYPARDVDLVTAALEKQRYLVLPLKDSDATRASILNSIQQAGEAIAGENLNIVFFFSGHGFAVNGENYLATLDADGRNLASSGLSIRAVEQALAKTPAARRILWIDACRDEPGKGVGEARSFANLQASAGSRLLLSTKAGKVSYEDEELRQGTFSYYLVKGLEGDAAGPDGLVTFQDLASYVMLQVRARSLKTGHVQVPYEAGEASGDFLLAHVNASGSGGSPAILVRDDAPHPGQVKVDPKDGQRYVWIPAGSFIMGCSPGDNECYDDEKPAHEVHITKGFWLGQTAVTVGDWRKVTGGAPKWSSSWKVAGQDHDFNPGWNDLQQPVIGVQWQEAKEFCESVGGRLPTEAEWEYAARAGGVNARYGDLDAIAWYANNSGGQRIDSAQIWDTDQKNYASRLLANGNGPHPVGLKQPNAWNLYDMLGNVWQWTSDWYGEKYYQQRDGSDPRGPDYGEYRVLRGGGWYDFPRYLRASDRVRVEPTLRYGDFGVRCVGE